jgi:hypothetical protein
VCLLLFSAAAKGQGNPPGTTSGPVVDSSTAGPMAPPHAAPSTDAAAEASPLSSTPHGKWLPAHAEVAVRLHKAIDSANVRNGDILDATLAAPVRASDGSTLPVGTQVGVTVLAVAAAGKLQSRGELTLQLTHVGPAATISDELTFFGEEGHKELPDSAPAKGTEASVTAGTTLRFHVAALPK